MRWPELFFKNKTGEPNPDLPKPSQLPSEEEAAELAEAERALLERENAVKNTPPDPIENLTTENPPAPFSSTSAPEIATNPMIQVGTRLLPRRLPAPVSPRPLVAGPVHLDTTAKFLPPPLEEPVQEDTSYSKTQRLPKILMIPRPGDVAKVTLEPVAPEGPFIVPRVPPGNAVPSTLRRAKLTDVARVVLAPRRQPVSEPEPIVVSPPSTPAPVKPEPFPELPTAMVETPFKAPPIKPISILATYPEGNPIGREAQQPSVLSTVPEVAPESKTAAPPSIPEPQPISKEEPSAVVPPAFPIAASLRADSASSIDSESLEEKSLAQNKSGEMSTLPRQDFLLTNGERIVGRILSESPEEIYLHNECLGVITLPRRQIALKPVEVILINGDRIVGDIIAETPDTLYVRHSSLGVLTIPRTQRSTRVVEALLKSGDRIVGEVLTKTDTFTVIRSATLGTVAVDHQHIEMLNSKVEQIEVKALAQGLPIA